MKKILLVVLTISASFACNNANAQWCGTVSSIIPTPTAYMGFPNSDSIRCAVQGEPVMDTILFQMDNTLNYLGSQTIDSVTIDTMWNFPCGLCYSVNKASKTYAASEYGVIYVTGTTNDAVGQYNLRFQVTAYINGDPTGEYIQNPNTVDAAGIKLWMRVASSGGSCTPVDTSVNGVDQVAAANCPTAINEVEANVASIKVSPNPMNASAVFSFIADKIAAYTVRLADITGKVLSVKQVHAKTGINTSIIERGDLAPGIYLVSLSDGQSSVTRKVSIVE